MEQRAHFGPNGRLSDTFGRRRLALCGAIMYEVLVPHSVTLGPFLRPSAAEGAAATVGGSIVGRTCALAYGVPVERVPSRQQSRRLESGFTLVELMVVVCVIAILATLAVYGVGKYVRASATAEPIEIINSIRAAQESYKDETFTYLDVSPITSFFPYSSLPSNSKKAWEGGDGTVLKNWNTLGVHPSTAVAFGYACHAANDNSSVPGASDIGISQSLNYPLNAQNWFVVRAESDRDGNGVPAIFVGSNFVDSIYGQDETE